MVLNWNTDEKAFKKLDPKGYKLWRIVQMINYGLDGEKLNKNQVKKAWPKIKDQLDPDARKVMEFYLWHKKWKKEPGLRPDRSNFWKWYHKTQLSKPLSISLEELRLQLASITTVNQTI